MDIINIILHCGTCKHKWTIVLPIEPNGIIELNGHDICPQCGAQAEPQEEDRAPK